MSRSASWRLMWRSPPRPRRGPRVPRRRARPRAGASFKKGDGRRVELDLDRLAESDLTEPRLPVAAPTPTPHATAHRRRRGDEIPRSTNAAPVDGLVVVGRLRGDDRRRRGGRDPRGRARREEGPSSARASGSRRRGGPVTSVPSQCSPRAPVLAACPGRGTVEGNRRWRVRGIPPSRVQARRGAAVAAAGAPPPIG